VIISLDPGKTTGVVTYDPVSKEAHSYQLDFQGTCAFIDMWLQYFPAAEVVMERFIIGPQTMKKTQAPWSLELIGVGRYLAHKHRAKFDLQSPADAKNFAFDQRLKDLNAFPRGDHARDAMRHLVLYWARTRDELPVVQSLTDG
jgi:hypothetical protein